MDDFGWKSFQPRFEIRLLTCLLRFWLGRDQGAQFWIFIWIGRESLGPALVHHLQAGKLDGTDLLRVHVTAGFALGMGNAFKRQAHNPKPALSQLQAQVHIIIFNRQIDLIKLAGG